MTPLFSRYLRNSSFLESGVCTQHKARGWVRTGRNKKAGCGSGHTPLHVCVSPSFLFTAHRRSRSIAAVCRCFRCTHTPAHTHKNPHIHPHTHTHTHTRWSARPLHPHTHKCTGSRRPLVHPQSLLPVPANTNLVARHRNSAQKHAAAATQSAQRANSSTRVNSLQTHFRVRNTLNHSPSTAGHRCSGRRCRRRRSSRRWRRQTTRGHGNWTPSSPPPTTTSAGRPRPPRRTPLPSPTTLPTWTCLRPTAVLVERTRSRPRRRRPSLRRRRGGRTPTRHAVPLRRRRLSSHPSLPDEA